MVRDQVLVVTEKGESETDAGIVIAASVSCFVGTTMQLVRERACSGGRRKTRDDCMHTGSLFYVVYVVLRT